jgi:hypothetical protein
MHIGLRQLKHRRSEENNVINHGEIRKNHYFEVRKRCKIGNKAHDGEEVEKQKIKNCGFTNTSRNCWGNCLTQMLASLCSIEISKQVQNQNETKIPC